MSVLVDCDILSAIANRQIAIEPFDRKALGTNSYDVHLAPTLRVYANEYEHVRLPRTNTIIKGDEMPLDIKVPRRTVDLPIPPDGLILQPGELYLASTVENTASMKHLPILNGKSSLGRLGLSIHVTAGTGDVGFVGHWTMELFVIKPLRIYAGMAVGQLLWFTTESAPEMLYRDKPSAKYAGSGSLPEPSKMHQEHARAKSEE